MIKTDLSNMPVKVLYRRMWEYSLDVESEDRQIINDLLEKIDRIQLGEKTGMGIDDYTDLIVFEYPDGHYVRPFPGRVAQRPHPHLLQHQKRVPLPQARRVAGRILGRGLFSRQLPGHSGGRQFRGARHQRRFLSALARA